VSWIGRIGEVVQTGTIIEETEFSAGGGAEGDFSSARNTT